MKQNKPYIIGLTGTIGSGKSTCAKILTEDFHISIVDADQIAYAVCEPGAPGLLKIAETFGEEFIKEDGSYDRERMRELVTKDSKALEKLNAILHPIIKSERESRFEALKDEDVIVYDCPLLFEAGEDSIVDEVITITVDTDKRIERLMDRDNLNREQAEDRIDIQLEDNEKIKRSDRVFFNNGTVEDLREALRYYLTSQGFIKN